MTFMQNDENLKKYDAVMITNIDGEEFSHKFEGETYSMRPGETMAFPHFLAKHLAKHLATKIVRRSSKAGDKGVQFNQTEIEKKMQEIIGNTVKSVSKPEPTPQERLRREVEELNSEVGTARPEDDGRTKAQIMAELDAAGIKYDKKSTRADLLSLLDVYTPKPAPVADTEPDERTSDFSAAEMEVRDGRLQQA